MKDVFSKLIFNILKNYMNVIMIYHFYQKEWKLKKVEKLVTNFHDKSEYVIHLRNLKQTLNHELDLEKVYRVNLTKSIAINTNPRRNAKSNFERDFFIIMQFLKKLWEMWEKI